MADIAKITTKEVMGGLTLNVRIARSFTIRTRVACWLIKMASKVIDVPCEIDMRNAGEIAVGDVVRHFVTGRMMTVAIVDGDLVECVWFDGCAMHRDQFPMHLLTPL